MGQLKEKKGNIAIKFDIFFAENCILYLNRGTEVPSHNILVKLIRKFYMIRNQTDVWTDKQSDRKFLYSLLTTTILQLLLLLLLYHPNGKCNPEKHILCMIRGKIE